LRDVWDIPLQLFKALVIVRLKGEEHQH